MGLGLDRTGLILVRSGPKVKDRTVKQSPFLVQTGPDCGQSISVIPIKLPQFSFKLP